MAKESLDVDIRASGYENVYFDCPSCGKENILNRATDLASYMPISRLDGVVCRNNKCKQIIGLVGDRVNDARYRWFLDELYIFVARKEYRSYVLSLCQGIEAFFHQAIINKKFDRNPAYRDADGRLLFDLYDSERKEYEKQIKTYPFEKMRKEFLEVFDVEQNSYLPAGIKLREDRREFAFNTVRRTKIHALRNKVAHKFAHRPTWSELEPYNENLVEAIYWLGMYLDVEDSIMPINRRLIPTPQLKKL